MITEGEIMGTVGINMVNEPYLYCGMTNASDNLSTRWGMASTGGLADDVHRKIEKFVPGPMKGAGCVNLGLEPEAHYMSNNVYRTRNGHDSVKNVKGYPDTSFSDKKNQGFWKPGSNVIEHFTGEPDIWKNINCITILLFVLLVIAIIYIIVLKNSQRTMELMLLTHSSKSV